MGEKKNENRQEKGKEQREGARHDGAVVVEKVALKNTGWGAESRTGRSEGFAGRDN